MADNYDNLYSCTVVDEDGSRIGAVSQVYLDDATAEPTFVAARVGFFGNKEVLVPLDVRPALGIAKEDRLV